MSAEPGNACGKLHRAHCIVGLVAESLLDADEALSGETLKAAEHLIEEAMQELQDAGVGFHSELKRIR